MSEEVTVVTVPDDLAKSINDSTQAVDNAVRRLGELRLSFLSEEGQIVRELQDLRKNQEVTLKMAAKQLKVDVEKGGWAYDPTAKTFTKL